MGKVVVYPFLRVPKDLVSFSEWVYSNEDAVSVGEKYPDWDCNTPVNVHQRVVVKSSEIFSACGLTNDDRVVLTCSWYSSGTTLRGKGNAIILNSQENSQDLLMRVDAEGGLLAGDLKLKTYILLMNSKSNETLAAHMAGSVLWQNEKIVILEGHGSRFPVEMVDFSGLNWLPEGAAWFLDWIPDQPEALFLGGMRLLINKKQKNIYDAVTAQKPNVEQQLIRSSIYHDVGRSLVRGMLSSMEFIDNHESFEEGTVGYHVRSLLSFLFPGASVSSLSSLLKERPEYFESKLKSGFRLFQVE